jgi:hypothetical protein
MVSAYGLRYADGGALLGAVLDTSLQVFRLSTVSGGLRLRTDPPYGLPPSRSLGWWWWCLECVLLDRRDARDPASLCPSYHPCAGARRDWRSSWYL